MFGPFVEHGMTMAEVREMTLYDVAIMHSYWKRNPPLRILVATVAKSLGVEFPDPDAPPPEKKYMNADELQRLIALTGGRIEGLGNV